MLSHIDCTEFVDAYFVLFLLICLKPRVLNGIYHDNCKHLFCIITIYHLKALSKMCKPKSKMNETFYQGPTL